MINIPVNTKVQIVVLCSDCESIACLNTNPNYLLIEEEKEYIDIIKKRIAEQEQQQALFKEG